MRNSLLFTMLSLVAMSMLTACGTKEEKKTESAEAPRAAVIENSQEAQKEDVTNTYDLAIDEKTYHVVVHRYSDTEKPVFTDDFGDEFYDNQVEITVKRDTATLINRVFSLESFESYIPSKYKDKVILQGIAPDEQNSTANGIVFGVTIGPAGSEDGQVLLVITMVPGSGAIDIRKDDTPDNIGMDQGKEGR